MALIKEYFELTEKYKNDYGENTILLMQVGSFFEVYGIKNSITNNISGSKISNFSSICDLNIVDKNVCVGTENILMAGFKDTHIEKYLKKIQDSGFTAVVYTQDESAKNTKRSLAGIFSPGTYFSNENTKLNNNLTCIWVEVINNNFLNNNKTKTVVVGVSNIDIYTGKTSIFQFQEQYINNPTTYDELERFISIYNPSEVIIISNLQNKEIDDVISFTNINCNLIHKILIESTNSKNNNLIQKAKNCEKQTYQKELLNKFYTIYDFDVFFQNFYENHIATQAFCFMLDFVYQHNPYLVHKISEPLFENCSNRLILANHSLKQLNIIDDNNYNGKYSSVLKMLNDCLTPMGKRKFNYNFLNPINEINILQREYDIVEYILNNYEYFNDFFKVNLSDIKDISKWERQMFLNKITPKAFYSLNSNILKIKQIYEFIIKDTKIVDYLYGFEKNINLINDYCDKINNFIIKNLNLELISENEHQTQNYEVNFIQEGVNLDLDKKTLLLKESELKLESIKNYLNSLINDKGKTSEFIKIYETEKNNFSLICTSRRCKILEDALPNTLTTVELFYINNNTKNNFKYKIGKKSLEYKNQSASNNSIFDSEISKICKDISTIKISLKDDILNVFNNFVKNFEVYQHELETIINFVTLIDLINCKAHISKKYNYCKPIIHEAEKSFINAKSLRHCLIEQIQTNEVYVTNDIILGDGNIDGILLYGTNAVGKTSLIRSIGIAVIMAQAGLYVPCKEFIYKPYNYIFTRILGNDNIFKGLSTFAVEMSELRTILRLSNKNSLILGDELCSGTENTSAISIFVAGIQKLYSYKSSFIFATHLHEIVDYEEIVNLDNLRLNHMSVIYDKENDILIYDRKLKEGPGNNMYGLEVCKSLNLPEDFLQEAYNIRVKYSSTESSILSLKTSHFNSKKIMGICENCKKNMGTEVHHLQHQKDSNEMGVIEKVDGYLHKNNLSNLVTLCKECHNNFHKTTTKHKKVKTSKGYIIKEYNLNDK